VHISTHIGDGTKNNQHTSSTQPHSQPRTMSEGAMANSVAADSAAPARVVAPDSAAPARVVAAVTAARAPGGTKKSLPVPATERIWKTKRPYKKRQKKSSVPAPAPQAAAPAEAPAPVPPLFTADNAMAQAPAEKKSPPPSLLPRPLWRPRPFRLASPSIRVVLLSRS
jgi:hypothetical protein